MQQIAFQIVTSPHPHRIRSKFAQLDWNLHLCPIFGTWLGACRPSSPEGLNIMSKRSQFWGQASGKLGEAVYYRAGGEQRTRTYVAKIKNPKTLAQMEQRITMGNLNAVFKNLAPIIRESFPNKKTNQSGWNAFVQANARVNKSAVFKEDAAEMGSAPLGLIVANGDLPLSGRLSVSEDWFDPESGKIALSFDAFSSIRGVVSTSSANVSGLFANAGAVYSYLTGNGNPLALPSEFKITILWGWKGNIVGGSEVWGMNIAQMLCKANSTEGLKTVRYVDASADLLDITPDVGTYDPENENDIKVDCQGLAVSFDNGGGFAKDNAPVWAAIISWTENGKTRCTRSVVSSYPLNEENAELKETFAMYQKGGEYWNEILTQYGFNANEVLGTTKEVEATK